MKRLIVTLLAFLPLVPLLVFMRKKRTKDVVGGDDESH